MGTPIETEPVIPSDCAGAWFIGCPGSADIWSDQDCEIFCGNGSGATCPPVISMDRGVGINPRYCNMYLGGGYHIFTLPHFCNCFGVYYAFGCSNEIEGELM